MRRNAAEWIAGLAGLAALAGVALATWLVFERMAGEARHWHEVARQAAYGLTMLHMVAVAAIVRAGGIALERLAAYPGSSGRYEDEVVLTILMWGAALPFIVIGDRFPDAHAGGVALGLVSASLAIFSTRIARRADRSVSTGLICGVTAALYIVFAHDETGDWLAPPTTAGVAMLATWGGWESWRGRERRRRNAA